MEPEKRIIEAAGIISIDGEIVSYDPTTPEGSIFEDILLHARAWRWCKVEDLLDSLYSMVGAKNEHTGYAFHLGLHPLQLCISAKDSDGYLRPKE